MTILGLSDIAFWIIATSALVNAIGGLLGSFLVLRRMSMLADAISHAVLPGLVAGVLITGTVSGPAMFIGAALSGVLVAAVSEALHRLGNIDSDAALGVSFTSFFALGIVMLGFVSRAIHLDNDAVLYGILETAALNKVDVLGLSLPHIFVRMVVAGSIIVVALTVCWKEVVAASFDPQLARTLGLRPGWVHAGLMGLTALFTVAAFEAVGSILVIAMLTAPAATAFLVTRRLMPMLLVAMGVGVVTAVVSRFAAAELNTSVASMNAAVVGGFFLLAVVFSPQDGVVWRMAKKTKTRFP